MSERPPRGTLPTGTAALIFGVWNEQLSSSTAAASASSSFAPAGLSNGLGRTAEALLPVRGRGVGRLGMWLGKATYVGAEPARKDVLPLYDFDMEPEE